MKTQSQRPFGRAPASGLWAMGLVLISAFLFVGALSVHAGEPAPGTVITKDNMDQFLDVLTPTLQWELRNGSQAKVVPYEHWNWPKAYQEATEKYSAQVKIDPDGRMIHNYVAGAPFPVIDANDPIGAFKWMWNAEQNPWYIDNIGCGWNYQLINSNGVRERLFGSNFWRRMRWKGRLYMDPKPTMDHAPEMTYTEQWGPTHDPPDLKGAGILTFRYTSNDVPDDAYIYLPELRKVRRIAMASRSDAFWGSDGDIDSIMSFNSKIGFWTFKILGDKKMLTMANTPHYAKRDIWCKETDGTGGMQAQLFCAEYELRPIVIIEGIPTGYSQYAYSKRIMYFDKEFYISQAMEGYDHGGKVWKAWSHTYERGTTPKSDAVGNPVWPDSRLIMGHGSFHDMQLNHSSNWDCPDSYLYPNLGIKQLYMDMPRAWNTPETFDVNYLIKSAGF